MKIDIRYLGEKDLFEMQVIEPHLRAHFLLTRELLNNLRGTLEQALLDSKKKKS